MRMIDIIEKKRDGLELTENEIKFFVDEYTKGNIPDYQASAFAMAVYFKSMTSNEITTLTNAMAKSGDMLDLSKFGTKTVDKHSSGGVGDKTTLIVAPIVAVAGGIVAKMSGRGLGFTGGTIDKLESIDGLSTAMSPKQFEKQAEEIGVVVAGQTGNMAPADKKLYALRDVTGTVDSLALIASSIMSKKLASGAKNIVLDVKVGSGAFMKTVDDAKQLANQMVQIGNNSGRNTMAFLTNMETPLGNNVGNSLEVIEAIEVLKGRNVPDLIELCLNLSAGMISLTNNITFEDGYALAKDILNSKKAFYKFKEMVKSQGGDTSLLDDTSKFKREKYSYTYCANKNGYITKMDALKIGEVSVLLGAGRATKEDSIDYSAGIILSKKLGDKVSKNDVIANLYFSDTKRALIAEDLFASAIEISDEKIETNPLIIDIIK